MGGILRTVTAVTMFADILSAAYRALFQLEQFGRVTGLPGARQRITDVCESVC